MNAKQVGHRTFGSLVTIHQRFISLRSYRDFAHEIVLVAEPLTKMEKVMSPSPLELRSAHSSQITTQ